ncbi:hypothetical protein M8J75_008390 [Diaphorina citri]|nr:hypothetical protein M8J75_008390 [Diaphorina citri]
MSRSGSRSSDGHPTKIAGLYDLEETLGRGHFAVVKLARHVFTGEKVAVKVIDKTKLDPVSQDHLYQEVRCMKLVQHPNVVRLYEVIDTNSKLYLILELGDGGDLYDYIMKHDAGLSETYAREYFAQIVRAISFCHKLHVVHRDLKPENVVFFERLGVVKLTDFGNRFNPGQKLETSCGSLAYSAPEILLGDSYDAPAVDVWSLGVILYMLVAGQAPFQEANDSETLTMIMDVKYRVPDHVTEECKRLIGRMLVREPEKRASLAEIAADPWLAPALQDDALVPLVSRETVSEEDHSFIITKMVNGKIASKEDILEALDKDEYNHITATYYLLAERKLRLLRQPKKPTTSTSASNHSAAGTLPPGQSAGLVPPLVSVERCSDMEQGAGCSPGRVNQALLSMSRHPGDVASRSRKCSIVTEEEDDDEDGTSGGGSHDRRGSRSEGKLNLAVAELRRESILLSEASTAPTPLMLGKTSAVTHVAPALAKTLPSALPSSSSPASGLAGLDGICEEEGGSSVPSRPSSGFNASKQRGTVFRKSRTASVSSSEASDEDEARHSRRGSTKSLHRRHEPPGPGDKGGGPAGGGGGPSGEMADKDNSSNAGTSPDASSSQNPPGGNSNPPGSTSTSGGPEHNALSGRHSSSRHHKRRSGETRLRESQSLNRITEVQEDVAGQTSSTARENNASRNETDFARGESADRAVCFKCCMEEMTSIERRLNVACGIACGAVEPNNNHVETCGKDRPDGSEPCEKGDRPEDGRVNGDMCDGVRERLGGPCEGDGGSDPNVGSVSPSASYSTVVSYSSTYRNLTNVYSRHNKYKYIHNSNSGGGGKGNYLSSSISCNDIPDDCHGNGVSNVNNESTNVKSSGGGKSRKFNTITRIKNRHNKENSGVEKCKSPGNGTGATSNGQPAQQVVNKNKKSNKNTLINRYLYLQKKLVQPLFGGKKTDALKMGRLYKAKSCSEVEKTSCKEGAKMNVLSKQTHTMQRCSKHVTECTAPLKVTASIVNIDHRTSTVI